MSLVSQREHGPNGGWSSWSATFTGSKHQQPCWNNLAGSAPNCWWFLRFSWKNCYITCIAPHVTREKKSVTVEAHFPCKNRALVQGRNIFSLAIFIRSLHGCIMFTGPLIFSPPPKCGHRAPQTWTLYTRGSLKHQRMGSLSSIPSEQFQPLAASFIPYFVICSKVELISKDIHHKQSD